MCGSPFLFKELKRGIENSFLNSLNKKGAPCVWCFAENNLKRVPRVFGEGFDGQEFYPETPRTHGTPFLNFLRFVIEGHRDFKFLCPSMTKRKKFSFAYKGLKGLPCIYVGDRVCLRNGK